MSPAMQLACIATIAWCVFAKTVAHSDNKLLLLISLDGFRWDYLKMVKEKGKITPNFDSLVSNGVTITDEGVKNAFVTKTFPNHYTIVTGLYEDSHGMVANAYYDPVYNSSFDIALAKEGKWWNNGSSDGSGKGPEPIWVTNEKGPQTIFKRRSGIYFWPGSEAKIKGRRPYYYETYNQEVPFNERAETVVKWFATEDDPINLGLLYYHEPDATGHAYGPDSEEMVDKIVELDSYIGTLIDKLKKHKLFEKINIILTSDHGMQQIPDNHLVSLTPHISESDVDHYFDESTFNLLYTRQDKVDSVYEALKGLEHVTVFKKEDIPAEFHYRYNRRIPSILVNAHPGWLVSMKPQNFTLKGEHGYNNSLPVMNPIFIAHGPVFKKGETVPQFNSVDIYPLMCKILDVEAAPNQGNYNNIKEVLLGHGHSHSVISLTFLTLVLALGFTATVAGIFSVAACRARKTFRIHRIPFSLDTVETQTLEGKTKLLDDYDEEDEIH